MVRGGSVSSLAPGFRFHPTDEELVRYYLKRKVTNKPFRFDPISVIDIYRSEPWDLPDRSRLKTRDLEWYFFSALDKKYGNGSKTNRATEKGYWKTTGKDRSIRWNSCVVGMKKTLVYHLGRAPRGERTNWVMHEYRLADEELEKAGVVQDAFVLCRIFQKSGTGPKNGEQYGAPFIEEEWDEDEEVSLLAGAEVVLASEVPVCDDVHVETNDLDQNFDNGILLEIAPLPLNFHHGETSNYPAYSRSPAEDDQKPIIQGVENHYGSDLPVDQDLLELPAEYELKSVKDDYCAEPSNNTDAVDVNYLFDEPYLDAIDNLPFHGGLFLEANDLSYPLDPNSADDSTGFDVVEDYLNFFDAEDNIAFDPSELLGSEDAVFNQELLSQKDVDRGNEEVSMVMPSKELVEAKCDPDASSSKQTPKGMKFESDIKYPFIKQASHMLGGIPAPPAFASEFPTKDAALQLHAAQSSSSIHVTAGMIRIDNMTSGGNGFNWSFDKNGNINIILSLGFSQGDVSPDSLVSTASLFSGKTGSVVSRGWFFLMFIWVVILSVSFKIGTYVCTK